MASATYTLTATCAGGDHATLSVVLDGGAARILRIDKDAIRAALTTEEIDDALLTILRVKARGATRAQITTALQNGFTVTI